MRGLRRPLGALAGVVLAAGLAALAVPGPARAQPSDYTVERLAVTIEVLPDGGVTVREAMSVTFPRPSSDLVRVIPLRHERRGLEVGLELDAASALDEASRPLAVSVVRSPRQARIRLAGLGPGPRTLTFLYRFRRGLLAVDEHQELVWRLKGADWEVPVDAAELLVALPPQVPTRYVWIAAAVGQPPRDEHATIEVRERFILMRPTRRLLAPEPASLALSWHVSVGVHPSRWRRIGWALGDHWPLALPLLLGAGAVVAWWAHRPSPRPGAPRREPPAGITPGEGGALLGAGAETRDAVATLLDLEARGLVAVEAVAAGPEGPDWELRFLAPDGPLAVRPFEAVLLDALFGPGPGRDPVRLSAIGGRGEPLAATVCRALDRALATAGLTTPRALPWMLRGAGVALAALAGGLALCAGAGTAVLALACGLGAAPLLLLGWCPWRRTRHGLARLGELRAFAQALARQEPDQLARMPAEARRAGLAWAVALGAEGGWLAALDEAPADEPPAWYHASGQRRAVVAGRFVHAATRVLHAGRRAG